MSKKRGTLQQRQGFENVPGDDVPCTKILRDGKVYTIMGQTVR